MGLHDVADLNMQKSVTAKSNLRTTVIGILTAYLTVLLPLLALDPEHQLYFCLLGTIFGVVMIIFCIHLNSKFIEYRFEYVKFLSVEFAVNNIWPYPIYIPKKVDIESATEVIVNVLKRPKGLVFLGLCDYYYSKKRKVYWWDRLFNRVRSVFKK